MLKTASPQQIGIVVIPSRREQSTVTAHLRTLLEHIPIPGERVVEYVPPDNVSSCPYGSNGGFEEPRRETIPEIPEPGLHFIVVDCRVDSGRTFQSAAQMLERRGIPIDKIWYFGYIDDQFIQGLHKAQDILDYTRHRRKE